MIQIFNIDHNDFAAEVANGNVSVNLTQLAKPFGKAKQPFEWLRTREAREYIAALISYRSTQNSVPGFSGTADTQEVNKSQNSELRKSSSADTQKVGNSKLGKSSLIDTQEVESEVGKSTSADTQAVESRVGKSTLLRNTKLTDGLITVKKGGSFDNQGTWAHDYRLVMRFAQWLSPEFSVKVDELLVGLLRGTREIMENDCPYTMDLPEAPAFCQAMPELLLDIMNDVCYVDDTALRTRMAAKIMTLRKSSIQSV